jgi:response regulator RpfG family c-di-GMP phosphodiesterase
VNQSHTQKTRHLKGNPGAALEARGRKTLLMFSPDPNLCMSFSMLYQDSYRVVTTTEIGSLESLSGQHSADILVVDGEPSPELLLALEQMKHVCPDLPIILLYVFDPRSGAMDQLLRSYVDTVFYKPFEIQSVSRRIDEIFHRT